MFQAKVVQKIKTHTLHSITLFFNNCAVYEMMCENTAERGRPQMTTWGMSTACWVTKATDTHSEYVIFIAFLQQQWLCKHTSVLCYTYVASPVIHHSTAEFVEKDMEEEELEEKGAAILCIQTHLLFL